MDIYTQEWLTHFHTLSGRQPFPLDSGMISSPPEWLLNPEIKSKYKRYLVILSSFFAFFPYNSLTAFIDQEVKPAKKLRIKRETKMEPDS